MVPSVVPKRSKQVTVCSSVRSAYTPMTDAACNVVYAAQGADVRLTMVDGEVLYRDGEFKTIDIEKVKAETQKRTDAILRRL